VGTFHATCARLLRRYHADRIGIQPDFTIYDDRSAGDDGARHPRPRPRRRATRRRRCSGAINRRSRRAGPADYVVEGYFGDVVAKVYAAYEKRMAKANAVDFEDLIYRCVIAMDEGPVRARELRGASSTCSWTSSRTRTRCSTGWCALAPEHRNVCVVGDDDQSIYRWRGADRRNILDFKRDFPDALVIKLEQNYRSTGRILRRAGRHLAEHRSGAEGALDRERDGEPKVLVVRDEDERDEAGWVVERHREPSEAKGLRLRTMWPCFTAPTPSPACLKTCSARTNVPYRVVGGMRFFERAEVKDVLAYLRVISNPRSDVDAAHHQHPAAKDRRDHHRASGRHGRRPGQLALDALAACHRLGNPGNTGKKALFGFRALLQDLIRQGRDLGPREIAEKVLEGTGYNKILGAEDTPEADARCRTFKSSSAPSRSTRPEAGDEPPSLAGYLERISLSAAIDGLEDAPRVPMMTVHGAKGLEFNTVFLIGMEEEMFPFRGLDPQHAEELEEERRLCYVAVTRARERLILSWASVRRIYGQLQVGSPSRFLAELPEGDVQAIGGSASRPAPAYPRQPAWSAPAAPRETAASSDAYVDYGDGQASDMLRRGMRVRHAKFGVGRVTDVGAGLPPRVSVDFPGWGTKQIVSTFLEPA
jgi:DNA helicase-2/ATP-dependent DNA helicase PcrA